MTKKIIVICDFEKDYGKKLLEAFNEKAQKDIKFFLFHDINLLMEFINKEIVCCLVLDSEIPVEARAEMKTPTKIVLTRREDTTLREGETKVRKYQHVDEIYKNVLKNTYPLEIDKDEKAWRRHEDNYNEKEENEDRYIDTVKESNYGEEGTFHKETSIYEKSSTHKKSGIHMKNRFHKEGEENGSKGNKKECKLIGVYSPIHRIGKTKFALELGKELGAKGPVLYLNLEPFAPGSYFRDKAEDNLEKLIYSAGQGHKNLGLSASMMASHLGEMDYIEPMTIANDLFNVRGAMWIEVIDRIINESIYETIILDLSDGISDLFSILEYCNVVYTLYIEEPVALSKLKQYTENLLRTGYESVLEHTIQKKVEVM